MKRTIWILGLLALCAACQPGEEETGSEAALKDQALAEALVGEWESLSMQITMPSWGGGDSTAYLVAEAHNWTEVMQMQPIRTYFLPDGTYYAEYRNLGGAITNRPSGTWEVRGDTLVYHERYPQKADFRQQVTRVNDTDFRFSFFEDFDQDGQKDDLGEGISRKLK